MRSEKQKMTRLICQYNYEYNGDGLLASIRKSTNRTDDILEEVLFEYDEYGNLSEKKIFRKGEITTDIQVIYDNKTGLLSSVISKYVGTGIITILRFDGYTFY